MTPGPLAVLGGSFDPVHHGHLRMALEAAHLLDASVALLPTGTPPHREAPVASPTQRLAMLELALHGQDRLSVDARELSRVGPSYTVDTLREMREEVGPGRPLILLIGTDQFAVLDTWHRWREIFDYAHIGVLGRPGVTAQPAAGVAERVSARSTTAAVELAQTPAGRVLQIPTTLLDISSSRIRADLVAGRSPRWLLPDSVLDYIQDHKIYQ